ncbi:MAG: pyridoxal phosphate-dependent aminotransferase [Thermoleophilia bacterium]
MKPCARAAADARRSTIRVLFDAASERPDAIRLEVGEPSFRTPAHVVEAAFEAARAGQTKYTPNGGLRSLRELLADRLERVNGYRAHHDEIVVTPGGMNALYSTYLALLEPGDEVLLPTPGFPNMDEMVKLVGGTPVFYELRADEGYLPEIERIEALVTPRTKVLFTNSPSNPCGSVFPAATVEALVRLADRHDLWLIADEVYDELILDPERQHVAARGFDEAGRVISVYSFSKVYAMTGWRLGYAVAPPPLADLLRKLQEPQVSCPSTVSQLAAQAALTGPQAVVAEMRDAYRERRDRAWAAIERRGLSGFRTQGTFYMLVDVSRAGIPSLDFSLRLLREADVAVAPGSVFGPAGEGKVRISMAVEAPEIEEGLARLAHVLEQA